MPRYSLLLVKPGQLSKGYLAAERPFGKDQYWDQPNRVALWHSNPSTSRLPKFVPERLVRWPCVCARPITNLPLLPLLPVPDKPGSICYLIKDGKGGGHHVQFSNIIFTTAGFDQFDIDIDIAKSLRLYGTPSTRCIGSIGTAQVLTASLHSSDYPPLV